MFPLTLRWRPLLTSVPPGVEHALRSISMAHTSAAQAAQGPHATVLLVEDRQSDARLLDHLIRYPPPSPWHTVLSRTMAHALGMLESLAIDLVLLDLGLTDTRNNEDTLERMLHAAHAPIIVVTGHLEPRLVALSEQSRLFGCVSKQEVFAGSTDLRALMARWAPQ